ncbi:hypothetical protein D8I24_3563 [Cupriavidus necator H850]|nr:hypothetical protein D8I24_3563 [Cupriavidus necator H850]
MKSALSNRPPAFALDVVGLGKMAAMPVSAHALISCALK